MALIREARCIVVLAILLLAAAPSIPCLPLEVVVVGPPDPPLRLKPRARITLLVNGEPIAGANISVRTNYAPTRASISPGSMVAALTSDSDGNVTLPVLRPGHYVIRFPSSFVSELAICVIPCPDLGLETTSLVPTTLHGPQRVLDRDSIALSELRMEIGPSGDPGWGPLIAAAEQQPAAYRVSELRGVVEDQSGAYIPGASIDVVVKGTQGKKHASMLRTDEMGRFSAHLPDGDYIGIVRLAGFRVRAVAFSVSSAAAATDLHIVLEVGAETETITLSQSTHPGMRRP